MHAIWGFNLSWLASIYNNRAIAPNLSTAEEVKINAAFRAAQMPIEKTTASPAVFLEYVTRIEATS